MARSKWRGHYFPEIELNQTNLGEVHVEEAEGSGDCCVVHRKCQAQGGGQVRDDLVGVSVRSE